MKTRLFILSLLLLTIVFLSYYPIKYYYSPIPDAHISMISRDQAFSEIELLLLQPYSDNYNLAEINITSLDDDSIYMLETILKVKPFSIISTPATYLLFEKVRQDTTQQKKIEFLSQRLRKGKPQFEIFIKTSKIYNQSYNNQLITVAFTDNYVAASFFLKTVKYTDNEDYKRLISESDAYMKEYQLIQKRSILCYKLLTAAAALMALFILELMLQIFYLKVVKKVIYSIRKSVHRQRIKKLIKMQKKKEMKNAEPVKSEKKTKSTTKINTTTVQKKEEAIKDTGIIQNNLFNENISNEIVTDNKQNDSLAESSTQIINEQESLNDIFNEFADNDSTSLQLEKNETSEDSLYGLINNSNQKKESFVIPEKSINEPVAENSFVNETENDIEFEEAFSQERGLKPGDYIIPSDINEEDDDRQDYAAASRNLHNQRSIDKEASSETESNNHRSDYQNDTNDDETRGSGFSREDEAILAKMKKQLQSERKASDRDSFDDIKSDEINPEDNNDTDELAMQLSKRIKLNHQGNGQKTIVDEKSSPEQIYASEDNDLSFEKHEQVSAINEQEDESLTGANEQDSESTAESSELEDSYSSKKREVEGNSEKDSNSSRRIVHDSAPERSNSRFINTLSAEEKESTRFINRQSNDDSAAISRRRDLVDLNGNGAPDISSDDKKNSWANEDDNSEAVKAEISYWESLVRINAQNGYSDYIRRYPKGRFIHKAKAMLEETFWGDTLKENSLKLYGDYIRKFPEGKYVAEADEKIESILWEKYDKINTINSYRDYCVQYPNGKYLSIATEIIAKKIIGNWAGFSQTHIFTEERSYTSDMKSYYPWQITFDKKFRFFAIVINMREGYNIFLIENMTVIQMQLYNKTSGKRIKLNKQLKSSGFRAR